MSQTPFKIVVGETTFPHVIADGQPMWRVTKSRGSNTFECTVEPDAPDYAGHVRVFGGEEIERAARMNAMWKDHFVTRGNFYASLTPGQIVHYNDAFAKFIRCRVVEKNGVMQLLPIALVGKWNEHDLPRWYDDGRYHDGGYHAQKIRDGSLEMAWQPDSACVYESSDYAKSYQKDGDPTQLPPLSLDKPEPTPAQAEAARLLDAIEAISAVCCGRGHQADWVAHHRERLLTIRTILDATPLEV